MDKVINTMHTGVKNLGIAMTFGAYHLYVMEQERNSWRKEQELINANQLLMIEQKLRENADKKWW